MESNTKILQVIQPRTPIVAIFGSGNPWDQHLVQALALVQLGPQDGYEQQIQGIILVDGMFELAESFENFEGYEERPDISL